MPLVHPLHQNPRGGIGASTISAVGTRACTAVATPVMAVPSPPLAPALASDAEHFCSGNGGAVSVPSVAGGDSSGSLFYTNGRPITLMMGSTVLSESAPDMSAVSMQAPMLTPVSLSRAIQRICMMSRMGCLKAVKMILLAGLCHRLPFQKERFKRAMRTRQMDRLRMASAMFKQMAPLRTARIRQSPLNLRGSASWRTLLA